MAARSTVRVDDGPRRPDPHVVAPRLAAILLDSFIVTVLQGFLIHYSPAFHLRIANPNALHGSLTIGFERQSLDLASRLGLTATLYFAYFLLFEMAIAATPGKLIAGLRVVDLSGRRATVPAALIRNLLRPIDAAGAYALGGIVVLASSRRQRIGDHAARTLVVSARSVEDVGRLGGGSLLLRSCGILLLLVLLASAVSYFVPPQLEVASGESFYPLNDTQVGGNAPGARSLRSVHVARGSYSPGSVSYRIRFDLTARRGGHERCNGVVQFHWDGPRYGWMYQNYSQSCSGHGTS